MMSGILGANRKFWLVPALIVLALVVWQVARAAPVAIGSQVVLTTKFRVMQTDLKTGVGMQEVNAAGVVTSGPVKVGAKTWWYVDFENGVDGWVSHTVLSVQGTAGVTASLSAASGSIPQGAATTLSWTSQGGTTCQASGGIGFNGAVPSSGSASVSPGQTTTYALSCTGANGTAVANTTVMVVGVAQQVTLTATPSTVAPGGSTILQWSAPGATGCTAGGASAFSGARAASGSATVPVPANTTYTISCVIGGKTSTATAAVTVGNAGPAAAFANPDDGNIPDRSGHPIAFPTAIGFGKATSVRAANAVVYKINTLEDVANPSDGKISYRECALALAVTTPYAIPAGRPRYCVFDVAGAIIMQSPAFITTPKIYIAGQTSPGGVEFRLGDKYDPVDSLIDTRRGGDHMILRHVRTRTGTHVGRTSLNGDPIRLSGTNYQILDHISTMFGTDESLDMSCQNCTVQWSIIGPNICRSGGHSASLHCKSFFLKPSSRVTIAHNLSQHGEQRGINIAVGVHPAPAGNSGQADIFNNVLYHFNLESGLISNQFGSVYANYINNVSLRGPRYNPRDGNYLTGLYNNAGNAYGFNIHTSGNVTPRTRVAGQFGQSVSDAWNKDAGFVSNVDPNTICGVSAAGLKDCTRIGLQVFQNLTYALMPGLTAPMFFPSQITGAEQAMRDVLQFAGANQCRDGSCRDNVDALYIDDVRTCDKAPYMFESNWAASVAEAGGWANITQGAARPDSDNDGMPDDWERRWKNTNPAVWDANADADGDGYPNIEEYLNALAQDDLRYYGMIGAGTGTVPAYNCGRPMY